MADEDLKFWTSSPNVFFVATNESDEAIGSIAYQEMNSNTVELNRLAVDSRMRGLRIGQKLINALQDTARDNGYENMYLDTSIAQMPAIKLYEKMNFKFLHCCKNEYFLLDVITGLHCVAYMKTLK